MRSKISHLQEGGQIFNLLRKLSAVQCYALTEVSERGQEEELYDSLTGVHRSVNRVEVVILITDFNTKMGSDNCGVESTMVCQGIRQISENGEKFMGFQYFDQ